MSTQDTLPPTLPWPIGRYLADLSGAPGFTGPSLKLTLYLVGY